MTDWSGSTPHNRIIPCPGCREELDLSTVTDDFECPWCGIPLTASGLLRSPTAVVDEPEPSEPLGWFGTIVIALGWLIGLVVGEPAFPGLSGPEPRRGNLPPEVPGAAGQGAPPEPLEAGWASLAAPDTPNLPRVRMEPPMETSDNTVICPHCGAANPRSPIVSTCAKCLQPLSEVEEVGRGHLGHDGAYADPGEAAMELPPVEPRAVPAPPPVPPEALTPRSGSGTRALVALVAVGGVAFAALLVFRLATHTPARRPPPRPRSMSAARPAPVSRPPARQPLHAAVLANDLANARRLLEGGADANNRDRTDGLTPLHRAASQGHLEMVKLLVEHGANVHAVSPRQETPTRLASVAGHTDVVEFLRSHGGLTNLGWHELHTRAGRGELARVKKLLAEGADVNVRNDDGKTPLHEAAYYGHLEVAQALLNHGADPNIKGKSGETPLGYAASMGHTDVAKLLLREGADVDGTSWGEQTALQAASMRGDLELVSVLLKSGADVRLCNERGMTALHEAAYHGHLEVARALLDKGADPNAKGNSGETPLSFAVSQKHPEVEELLRARGARD